MKQGLFFFALSISFSLAQGVTKPIHTSATLITEYDAIDPTQENFIGIRIHLEKNWHTYYLNPGDSGAPPKPKWQLPSEWTLGPLLWPTPKRISVPPFFAFGYEKEVLLMVPLTFTGHTVRRNEITIRLDLEWLACKVECIPYFATLRKTLPIQSQRLKSKDAPLFERVRSLIPKQKHKALITQVTPQAVTLKVTGINYKQALDFIPHPNMPLAHILPEFSQSTGQALQIVLKRYPASAQRLNPLKGLLILNSSQHSSNAVIVEAESPKTSSSFAAKIALCLGVLLILFLTIFKIILRKVPQKGNSIP